MIKETLTKRDANPVVTPILGAIIADQYLGKYKTILLFCVFYWIGLLILCTTSLPIFTIFSTPQNTKLHGRSKSPQRTRSQTQTHAHTHSRNQVITRLALRTDGSLELASSGNQDVAVLEHAKIGRGAGKGRWTHVALVWHPHRGSNPSVRELQISFFSLLRALPGMLCLKN